jgi:hypothetical protein
MVWKWTVEKVESSELSEIEKGKAKVFCVGLLLAFEFCSQQCFDNEVIMLSEFMYFIYYASYVQCILMEQ